MLAGKIFFVNLSFEIKNLKTDTKKEMKNIILLVSLLLSVSAMAQTKVVKANAVKANDYGVTYSLPKTQLVVDAEVTKVTCKAGPYYRYAEKYLGVKKFITEDKIGRAHV